MIDAKVILLHGKSGSGKDSVAYNLVKKLGSDVEILPLAAPIKHFARELTYTDPAIWFGESKLRNEKTSLPNFPSVTFTPRELLTGIGDILIDLTGTSLPAYWALNQIYERVRNGWDGYFIVPDVRYLKEFDILYTHVARVVAVKVTGNFGTLDEVQAYHRSEAGIEDYYFSLVVDNKPGELANTVDTVHKHIVNVMESMQCP